MNLDSAKNPLKFQQVDLSCYQVVFSLFNSNKSSFMFPKMSSANPKKEKKVRFGLTFKKT